MRLERDRQHHWREHIVVTLTFVLSRLILYLAGLRFKFSLDWMWLSDPADLQDRLLQTIYYFHAFPPGMDLLSGILLKLGGAQAATLAQLTFWVCGLVLVSSLYYLARAAGLSAPVSFVASFAFSLLPQTLYFEHLYLYEEPVAALLCLSVALFHGALRRQSWQLWLAFFSACAIIGVTRSTFHLMWFVAMIGAGTVVHPGALITSGPHRRKRTSDRVAGALREEPDRLRDVQRLHLRTVELRACDGLQSGS